MTNNYVEHMVTTLNLHVYSQWISPATKPNNQQKVWKGQTWVETSIRAQCGSHPSRSVEDISAQVLTDSHAPARFRINGPLADQPEFSQVLTLHNNSFEGHFRTGAVLLGHP